MTFTLPKGGIVGVIGPNGAGKTTLFRMLVGQEQPDAGTLKVGETVQIGYVDQSRESLNRRQDGVGGDLGRRGRARARQEDDQLARVRVVVQLPRARSAAEGRHALGRPAQPPAPREAAPARLQSAAARRADQRPRRRHACARSRKRSSTSPAAPSSSRTTAGSSTASPRTSSRSKATATSSGSQGTTRTTRSDKKRRLGADADQPHRIKYRKLTR